MSAVPKPKLLPKPGKIKLYQAIASYDGKSHDELSFGKGDLLFVLEQCPDGWWKAKCNGQIGLVPCTYVNEKEEVCLPLHDSVRRGNISFLQECLRNGISHTSLDSMQNTPLYWAAASGHVDCLELLIACPSAPINAQNCVGETALHAASARGHLDVVTILLAYGADPTIQNSTGDTPEDLARNSAVKNKLRFSLSSKNCIVRSVSYAPQEYDDDSDS